MMLHFRGPMFPGNFIEAFLIFLTKIFPKNICTLVLITWKIEKLLLSSVCKKQNWEIML